MSVNASSLRIAWWNCGLSPRGRKPKQPEPPTTRQRHLAAQVVSDLLLKHGVEILVVGEIDPIEADSILKTLASPRRVSIENQPETRIAVYYADNAVTLATRRTVEICYLGKDLRRIESLEFAAVNFLLEFRLFACHWPSRLQGDQARRERDELAIGLKQHIRQLEHSSRRLPFLLIGDFNDEPFDASLSQHLGGSRNRDRVNPTNGNLYNPFWRQLGEREPHPPRSSPPMAAGTCFYQSDPSTRWFTVDQALVSSEFVQSTGWILDEASTGIVQQAPLLTTKKRRIATDFDHFPILVSLQYLEPRTSGSIP